MDWTDPAVGIDLVGGHDFGGLWEGWRWQWAAEGARSEYVVESVGWYCGVGSGSAVWATLVASLAASAWVRSGATAVR